MGNSHDLRDGFLHFCQKEQLSATLQKHFFRQDNLWLIEVAISLDDSSLVFEASQRGDVFPHLYRNLKYGELIYSRQFELFADFEVSYPPE